jgi:hypothetical protein
MKVRVVHERLLTADTAAAGVLIDGLSSSKDKLWPHEAWPAMKFDGALAVGATGGHGPIRYSVEAYSPGRRVRFRFSGPMGFDGFHGYELEKARPGESRLRHVLEMDALGRARWTWPLMYRPLHDALIEDSLDRAQAYCGLDPPARSWSGWVRFLRWAFGRRSRASG